MHGSSLLIHVDGGTLTEFRGESKACLDQLLALKPGRLLANNLDTVHDGVTELVRSLADPGKLRVDT